MSRENPTPLSDAEAIAAAKRLHALIDERASALARELGPRITCHLGCSGCCRDALTVFEVEARLIRTEAADLLATAEPAPPGRCAFLSDAGACRIYEHRPYVCRTHGLPLAWLEEADDEPVEVRDICPLNEAGEPIESLSSEHVWEIGPFEETLQALQALATPDTPMLRCSLRQLWPGSEAGPLEPPDLALSRVARDVAFDDQETLSLSEDQASYRCTACHETIFIPIDRTEGPHQEFIEDCPVCCRPQRLLLTLESDGSFHLIAEPC